MLITSNRSIGEWGTVFGDPVVATAILDRLLHHSQVITIRGDSYPCAKNAAPASSKRRSCTRSGPYETGLPRRVHRNLPRSAPPAA